MIKQILTVILCFFYASFISAQSCDLVNGSFETWEDLTELYAEDLELEEPLPAGTVMLPEGYFSFLRLFLSIIGDVIGGLFGEELEVFASTSLGVSQVTDTTDGDYAVRIGGDASGPIADLIGISEYCGTLPDSFLIDVKHVGNGADTLYVQGSFDESSLIRLEESELEEVGAYFLLEHTDNTVSEYQTISVPVIANNNGVSNDSLIVFILAVGNEEAIAAGDESYFIVDNMRFDLQGVLSQNLIELEGDFSDGMNSMSISTDLNSDISNTTLQRSLSARGPFGNIASLDLDQVNSYDDYGIEANTVYYYRVETELVNGAVLHSELLSIKTGDFIRANALSVFPNPLSETSVIKFRADYELQNAKCYILDGTGKKVKDLFLPKFIEKGSHLIDLSSGDLISGLYNCRIESAASSWTISFVVL